MIAKSDEILTRNGGFSTIDVLVSTIVFAIVSLGVTSSTLTAIQTSRASQQKAVAINLGHQVLECVKSQLEAGRPINPANAGQDCNPSGAPAGYVVAVPAPSAGTGAFTGMTRLQTTISWRSPLPDQIELDSYIDT